MQNSTDLLSQNRALQSALDSHKRAFESMNDDFVDFRKQADRAVGNLEAKVSEQKRTILQLQQALERKTMKLTDLDRENTVLTTSCAELKGNVQKLEGDLTQSQIRKQSISALEQKEKSQLPYLKLSNQQLQKENEDLKLLVQELQNQKQYTSIQPEITSDTAVYQVPDTDPLLRKCLLLAVALGAPLDIVSINDTKSVVDQLNKPDIERLADQGLYLLGLEKQQSDSEKPWRAPTIVGQIGKQSYEQTATKDIIIQDLQRQILQLNHELERSRILQQKSQRDADQLRIEQEKLILAQKAEAKQHLAINDGIIKQNRQLADSINAARDTVEFEKAKQKTSSVRIQEIEADLQQLQRVFSSLDALHQLGDLSTEPVQAKLQSIFNEVCSLKLPQPLNVAEVMEQQQQPLSIIQSFEQKFEELRAELLEAQQTQLHLTGLCVLLLGLEGGGSAGADLEQTIQQVQKFAKSLKISEEALQQLATQDSGAQALDDLNARILQQQDEIRRLNELVERRESEKQISVSFTVRDAKISTELSDVQRIVTSTAQQNRSKRYVSFLELLVVNLIAFVQQAPAQVNQLSNILRQQTERSQQLIDEFQVKSKEQLAELHNVAGAFDRVNQVLNNAPDLVQQLKQLHKQQAELSEIAPAVAQISQQLVALYKENLEVKEVRPIQLAEPEFRQYYLDLQQALKQYNELLTDDRQAMKELAKQLDANDQNVAVQLGKQLVEAQQRAKRAETDSANIRKQLVKVASTNDELYEKLSKMKPEMMKNVKIQLDEAARKHRSEMEAKLLKWKDREAILMAQIATLK